VLDLGGRGHVVSMDGLGAIHLDFRVRTLGSLIRLGVAQVTFAIQKC